MSDVGLYLADGDRAWPGRSSVGAPARRGRLGRGRLFTTAMTGYQEALTDPSFARQILTFTAPMIGNYGVEDAASESRRVAADRADLPRGAQLRAERPHGPARLAARGRIVALSGLDTRALVRHLRDRGAMLASPAARA